MKIRNKDILFYKGWFKQHVVIWFIFILFYTIVDPVEADLKKQILGSITIFGTYIVFFYLSYFFLFFKLLNGRYINFILNFFAFFFAYYISMLFSFTTVINYYDWSILKDPYSLYGTFSAFFVTYCLLTLAAYSVFQNRLSIYNLELENRKERTLLQNQVLFYKNQFNSHITFNFLNYCYNHFLENDKETAKIVSNYADMLRYLNSTKSNETVTVSEEVDFIEKYLQINRGVFKNFQVLFNYDGELMNKRVLPRLFMTLIENAIKHGESQDINNPILVNLNIEKDILKFTVTNKKALTSFSNFSTHTGIKNIVSHLNLFYGSKYKLLNKDDTSLYKTELIINLN